MVKKSSLNNKIDSSIFLAVILLISLAGTVISFYLSEVLGLLICYLCWYQRMLIVPIALLTLLTWWQWDQRGYKYILPFSILGMLIAGYHYLSLLNNVYAPDYQQTWSLISFIGFSLITFTAYLWFRWSK